MKFLFPDTRLTITAGDLIAGRSLYLLNDIYVGISAMSCTLFNQSNYDYVEAVNNNTSEDIDYDFGEAATVDYIFLGRADYMSRMSAGDITVTVSGANISDFSVKEDESFSFGLADIIDNHYVAGLTFSTDYRYYRINFSSATSGFLKFRNLWIGEAFQFASNHEQPSRIESSYKSFQKLQNKSYRLDFLGVSNAKKVEFESKIANHKEIANFALWDADNDYLLNSDLLYFTLNNVRYRIKPRTDSYDLIMDLENVI